MATVSFFSTSLAFFNENSSEVTTSSQVPPKLIFAIIYPLQVVVAFTPRQSYCAGSGKIIHAERLENRQGLRHLFFVPCYFEDEIILIAAYYFPLIGDRKS